MILDQFFVPRHCTKDGSQFFRKKNKNKLYSVNGKQILEYFYFYEWWCNFAKNITNAH